LYLVGIDVGTTNTKSVVLDAESGQVRSVGSCRTITQHPNVEWSEFDAGALWSAVVQSLRQALAQCDRPEHIGAVAVASMAESGVPLDRHGNILYPAIAWYDPRTASQAQWWLDTLGTERVYDITGQVIHAMYGINKLLWLRDHEPEVFARIHRWLNVEDFILWKLSGSIATDYSIASRTMVFDQRALAWSKTLLEHVGIPGDWFAPAYPGGTVIGTISGEAAAETGLPQSALVVTGGHDHLCGALAAGITHPGQLLDSTGTACAICILSHSFQPKPALLAAGCHEYAYVLPGSYVILGSMNYAGGALEWLVKMFYGDIDEEKFARALHESAQVPRGSRGVTLLPYFLGSGTPHAQHTARAAILGLNPSHGRAELVRALLEGLAFCLRDNLEAFYSLDLLQSQPEIIAIGGAARARELMQIKAEITGCRIRVPWITEAVAAGAALLAGMGAGIFTSGEEAAASLRYTETIYEPGAEPQASYDAIYHNHYVPARKAALNL
jgi:xylulokinase